MAKSPTKAARQKSLGIALVIEDDAVLAMTIEQVLLDAGAKSVTLCSGAAEAMAELETNAPDIVILDVHLSDRDDGWAFAELLTQLGPKPPLIVFSTGNPESIPEDIAPLGVVLAKPYAPEALVDAIRNQQRGGTTLLGKLRGAFTPTA